MEAYKNKVAVVTGASAGIGAATVKALANAGLKVVGLARRVEKVEKIAKEVKANKKFWKPGKVYAVKADISKEEDIIKAFKWISDNVGPIEILINNAGIMTNTQLIDGDTELWRNVLDTNVLGLTIATREAIKIMTEKKINGHIININSVAGHIVPNFPKLNVYAGSKHAVTALTETLRLELVRAGSKIKVTSLSPGYVKTELAAANNLFTPEEYEAFAKNLQGLDAVDIANGIIYIITTPPHVQITELSIVPVGQTI